MTSGLPLMCKLNWVVCNSEVNVSCVDAVVVFWVYSTLQMVLFVKKEEKKGLLLKSQQFV